MHRVHIGGSRRRDSLQLWRKHFHHPETIVVCIDIDPECAQFDASAEGNPVRVGKAWGNVT